MGKDSIRLETCSTIQKLPRSGLLERTVIVVDVLRASSSIIWAIKNGAAKVIPALEPGTATALSMKLGTHECVLAGERGGRKMPGFALGNSPEEFIPRVVWGKNVIISTTNGTAAINAVQNAKHVLIGGMINRTSVAKRALEYGDDIIILCAGTDGMDSADDLCAAGSIIDAISRYADVPITPSDMTLICSLLYADWKEGVADLSTTHHYSHLVSLGMGSDVEFCLRQDMTTVVPEYLNGCINQRKENDLQVLI
ncbi:MAG: 2-phosphosulfolactate phosphatase [Clostridia bacterium]